MIHFRCWYCDRRYKVRRDRIGQRISCSCKNLLRVPRRDGGNCRVRRPIDWLIEGVVYGGGGALLGLGLALVIISQFRFVVRPRYAWMLVPALTLIGFVAGFLGGERGVSWLGKVIRDRDRS